MKRNIKLVLAYDGTNFNGYQIQKSGRTVQDELQKVISRITNESIDLTGAARTDSGVHASGQVVNFLCAGTIPLKNLLKGMNALLPEDIVVRQIQQVPESFHARFSAVSRRYVYTIDNNIIRSPFRQHYMLHYPNELDIELISGASKLLIGEKDFSSFRASGDDSRHSIRRIISVDAVMQENIMNLTIEANAFLQRMVRNIVGTLLLVGRSKISIGQFEEIINAKDRRISGPTIKPHGLCLVEVKYASEK